MTPSLSERRRQLVLGGGFVLVALLGVTQPWRHIDAFVYPPHAAMLLLPFGVMPPGAALAIWAALNLFCLFRAGELLEVRRELALLAALPAAALLMVATGYPAGFLALMATVVITRGRDRPALAGLCLALMTVHPQLALLSALVLSPFGYWPAVAAGAAWTLALLAVSAITMGLDAWVDYLRIVG